MARKFVHLFVKQDGNVWNVCRQNWVGAFQFGATMVARFPTRQEADDFVKEQNEKAGQKKDQPK